MGVDWILDSMTDSKRRRMGILLTLLLLLVVVGLAGHFIVDVSGHETAPAVGLHAGFVLLPFIVISRTLMLVVPLLDNTLIHHWRFILPLIQPPTSLS